MARERVLLVLPQMPHDPSSGAARSMLSILRALAESGASVRCLATTASEGSTVTKASDFLRRLVPEVLETHGEFHFSDRGVVFRLLATGATPVAQIDRVFGRAFDVAFHEELREFQPDILFTYWGVERDRARFRAARQQGAKVVVGLRNHSYVDRNYFELVDAVLTSGEALTRHYREKLGIESTPLPTLLDETDVIAPEREAIFIATINPSPEKGLVVMARIAEELASRRPDIPLLIVESRGSAGALTACGLRGGFDLRRHENIMISGPVALPRELFAPVRVLLVPSLLDAAPRVVPEAMVNGIPVLVSDRGGLPDMVGDVGFVHALPPDLTPQHRKPIPPEVVEPWLAAVIRMVDDEAHYQRCCERMTELSKVYSSIPVKARYVEFFRNVLNAPGANLLGQIVR